MMTLAKQLHLFAIGAIDQNLDDSLVKEHLLTVIGEDTRKYNTTQAGEFLDKSESSLRLWRMKGTGPEYVKESGGRVYYTGDALRAYQDQCRVPPSRANL